MSATIEIVGIVACICLVDIWAFEIFFSTGCNEFLKRIGLRSRGKGDALLRMILACYDRSKRNSTLICSRCCAFSLPKCTYRQIDKLTASYQSTVLRVFDFQRTGLRTSSSSLSSFAINELLANRFHFIESNLMSRIYHVISTRSSSWLSSKGRKLNVRIRFIFQLRSNFENFVKQREINTISGSFRFDFIRDMHNLDLQIPSLFPSGRRLETSVATSRCFHAV